jgi:hypothetical protein
MQASQGPMHVHGLACCRWCLCPCSGAACGHLSHHVPRHHYWWRNEGPGSDGSHTLASTAVHHNACRHLHYCMNSMLPRACKKCVPTTASWSAATPCQSPGSTLLLSAWQDCVWDWHQCTTVVPGNCRDEHTSQLACSLDIWEIKHLPASAVHTHQPIITVPLQLLLYRAQLGGTTGTGGSLSGSMQWAINTVREQSDWACACVLFYDRVLTAPEYLAVEFWLDEVYCTVQAPAPSPPPRGPTCEMLLAGWLACLPVGSCSGAACVLVCVCAWVGGAAAGAGSGCS